MKSLLQTSTDPSTSMYQIIEYYKFEKFFVIYWIVASFSHDFRVKYPI